MRKPVNLTRPLQLLITLMILSALALPTNAAGGRIHPAMDFLLVSPDSRLTPEQALAMGGWQSLEDPSPNFGYIRKSVWLRFPVPERGDINLLEIGYAHLDHVRFFLLENGEVVDQATAGDRLPFLERPVLYRNFLFRFNHAPEADQQILLQITTSGAVQVPVSLWHDKDFFESAFFEDLVHAVYYGILITVICFNLFIFVALREKIYLLYVLSTLGYLVIIGSLNGIAYQLLWPANPEIQNRSMVLGIPFAVVFTLWFAHAFLRLRSQSPATAQVVSFAIILNILAAAATFLTDYNTGIRLVVALTMPSCLLLTLLGPQQWLRGNRQAIYYTLAWGALTLGSAVTAANKYGLLPNSFLSVYAMQIGSALQAVLLALAMAIRIYQERQDKVLAREAELRALEARRKVELRLMDQALHHPLTGLPNRSSFEMMLNDLAMRHPERRYGIAVIHLNNLSSVTKTLGHRNTDRILELAARHYNSVVQTIPGALPVEQTDERNYFLASLDQQSFGFIVDASLAEASPRSVIFGLDSLRQSIDYLGMQVPLDPRMGVAIFPDHGADASTLIRRAIIAEGSDRARDRGMAYYKPSRDAYSADRLTMVSELRKALEDNQLALYLQPKQSLITGEVVGMEALIRWPDRQKTVSPDELVLLAEQTGLIKPLTRWVLEESLRLRTQLLEQGWDLELSANISPNNLREADFSQYVQQLMTRYDGHRGAVTFEVTETSMMLDPANSLQALNALNAAGIQVSIDDFGSGYSSLSYIKQLPASEIKIDRSLITELPSQPEDRVIVQTTIDMCHNLGYQVVAEGVEDQATADLLRGMGCDMIQGYLVTPPLPVDRFLDWLQSNQRQATRKLG